MIAIEKFFSLQSRKSGSNDFKYLGFSVAIGKWQWWTSHGQGKELLSWRIRVETLAKTESFDLGRHGKTSWCIPLYGLYSHYASFAPHDAPLRFADLSHLVLSTLAIASASLPKGLREWKSVGGKDAKFEILLKTTTVCWISCTGIMKPLKREIIVGRKESLSREWKYTE